MKTAPMMSSVTESSTAEMYQVQCKTSITLQAPSTPAGHQCCRASSPTRGSRCRKRVTLMPPNDFPTRSSCDGQGAPQAYEDPCPYPGVRKRGFLPPSRSQLDRG
eukprot:CAMPEP_0174719146 /NCGR_PEP_ID=MMETSP1094-20130205/30818_1 /TAXON_ID=156173 /ORGANISM="Chrysochromulina brevifilum, Strain UTEX LB 985" /LENGTH=104 /DNA_ID=CAMNT_0015919411 /DNA_START=394 /DNA_END=705 /DNA_ORIENTATION=+